MPTFYFRHRQYLFLSIFIFLSYIFPIELTADSFTLPGEKVPGRFIIKLKSDARPAIIRNSLSSNQKIKLLSPIAATTNITNAKHIERYYIFSSPDSSLTIDIVTQVVGAANIEHIEQDRYLHFFDFPPDSLISHQWYLRNDGQQYYGIERIAGVQNDNLVLKNGSANIDIGLDLYYLLPPANTTRVVVAIVDSGVDLHHPELADRIWHNPDEIPGNGIDDDHNGYIDDITGYDISGDTLSFFDIQGDNDPTDIIGHGSHLAGIVASRIDSVGIVGVAPMALIMPVKIRPNATNSVGAAGIIYAVANGADVINVSWGSEFESLVLKDAVDFARDNGVFVSISTGNTGSDKIFYPAAFDSAFAVGASDSQGRVTLFSTFGAHIDIVAPGEDILSIRGAGTDMFALMEEPGVHIIGNDSLYYLSDGTSMSAPIVAGAAALMLSVRPDLSLDDLESLLRLSATDIIDPFNNGSSFPGYDSISGHGMLDIDAAMNLVTQGGIHIILPISRNRHTGDMDVRIAGLSGYSSGWQLYLSEGAGNTNWQLINSGSAMPADSIAYQLQNFPGSLNGLINLRLADDFSHEQIVSFVYVSENRAEIISPIENDEHNDFVPIMTNSYGIDYDSLQISFVEGSSENLIFSSSGEFFDSLTYVWGASGLDKGDYTILLRGFFKFGEIVDSVRITINSSFAQGWPQPLAGRGALSPVVADLDGDGSKEIIIGTTVGLHVFNSNGSNVDGFPVLPEMDMRCIPAIYDIDKDGKMEIITVNKDGIWVFNHDGSLASSPEMHWPQLNETGLLSYGFPNPAIIQLGTTDDSAISIINNRGDMLAYSFDGFPYFYSLGGYYTSLNPIPSGSFFFAGNAVSAADLTGNGQQEVVLTYSASGPTAGVGIFDGRTGEPAFGMPAPHVIRASIIYGTVLADLNGDELNEIIVSGYDFNGVRTIWVKTYGNQDLPGWPRQLPELDGWRGAYPMVADLDLDGVPEVLVTFFEFETSSLYIFRGDGSPYITNDGRPEGEVYNRSATFGVPIVANLIGDDHPEIIIRSGHILPGTGSEEIHILDFSGTLVPGYPIETPARPSQIFSTIYAPLVDDLDSDGLVELILVSDALEMYVWDFEASSNNGANTGRLLIDNMNTSILSSKGVITDVDDDDDDQNNLLPADFALAQNYPNPFNPVTNIMLDIPRLSQVRLDVFNLLGQQVANLINRKMTAGRYTVRFDGEQLASGVYFYRLTTDETAITRKMVLLK